MTDFDDRLAAAGCTPDKPMHAILTAVYEAAETARSSVATGARGLTPQGEADLIRKLTEAVDHAASQAFWRFTVREASLCFALGAGTVVVGMWLHSLW